MRRPGLGSNTGRAGPIRTTGCVAGALAVLAVTAACSSAPSHPATPGSTMAVTPPPPAATTTAADALQQQLTEAVTNYQRVYSSVYTDPTRAPVEVPQVAAGDEATSLSYQAKQVADQHLVVGGAIQVLRVSVVSVTPDPPVVSSPATAIVKSCDDVSSFTAVNPAGKSVIDPRRLPQTQATFTLTNPTPIDGTGWRVTKGEAGPTIPCDPS